MPVSAPGLVPTGLDESKPNGGQEPPPITPPPVKNVAAPRPQLPNAPTVRPPAAVGSALGQGVQNAPLSTLAPPPNIAPQAPVDRRDVGRTTPFEGVRTADFQMQQPPGGGFRRFDASGGFPVLKAQSSFAPPSVGLSDIDPQNSLRGQQITPGQDPRLAGVRSDVDAARGDLTGFDFNRVGSQDPSTAAASGLLEGAAGELQGARLNEFGPVAPTDLGAAQASLDQAGQDIGGIQAPTFGDIGGSDVSGALSAFGRAQGQIAGSQADAEQARLGPQGAIAGTDISGAQAGIDRAQQNIAGSALDTSASDITRDLALEQVQGLEGPNRQELAQRSFDLLGDQADRDFEIRQRDVGRKAATFGRIGQGQITTELGTLEGDRERFLAQAREGLGLQAADSQLSDQLNRLGATVGAGESFEGQAIGRSGLGLSQASAESGLAAQREALGRASRGEEVGERGFQSGQDAQNAQLALSRSGLGLNRAGAEQGLGSQLEGAARADRGEQVGERDFASNQGLNQASLAGQRAGARQSLAGQQAGLAGVARGDELDERGFAANQDAISAQLALERSQGLRGLSGDTFGQGAAGRSEERGERGAEFDATRATLGDLSGLETQSFNEGVGERNEFRGERGFQDNLANQATRDALNQIQLEDQLQNSAFGREQARLNSIGNAGFQGVGTGGFSAASNNLGNQAQDNTAFIQQLMAAQAAEGGGIPPRVQSVGQTNPGQQGFA